MGSGCLDIPAFAKGIRQAKTLFDFAKSIGMNFTLLDLGGGFMGDKANSLIQCSQIINAALDKHFPGNDVTVIAEPGRYFVTTSSILMASIHSKRQIISNNVVEKNMYFINDGTYGSLSSVVNEARIFVPCIKPSHMLNGPLFCSSIWGPTSSSLDKVVDTVMLPDLQINDIFGFDEVGAYSNTLATEFNGYSHAKTRYFIERSIM